MGDSHKNLGIVGVLIIAVLIWLMLSFPASPFSKSVPVSNPPPGTGSDGIKQPNDLISSHKSILNEKDYKLVYKKNRKKVLVKSTSSKMIIKKKQRSSTIYINTERSYTRTTYDNREPQYQFDRFLLLDLNQKNPVQTTEYISKLVRRNNFYLSKVMNRSGMRFMKFKLVNGKYTEGSLLIRKDGLIKSVHIETRGSTVDLRFRLSPNMEIKPPDWLSTAREIRNSRFSGGDGSSDGCTDEEDGDDDGSCNDEIF